MPASEPTAARPGIEPEGPILYAEDGWSWAWILAAPAFCAAAAGFELATGAPVHWLMLTVCAIATALCHGVMIAATRVHGRVRVTYGWGTLLTNDFEGLVEMFQPGREVTAEEFTEFCERHDNYYL